MTTNRKKLTVLMAVSAGLTAYINVKADITSFTPGDLVVLRAGTGASALPTSGAVPGFLDQYTTSGVAAGTVTLPTTNGAGGNALMFDPVSDANHEAILTLSTDGHWLTFAGYNTSTGSTSNGAIAEVGQSVATLNTSTGLVGQGQVRGVISEDGGEFWTTSSSNGLQYFGSLGGSATTINSSWNARALNILNNTALVVGSGSNSVGVSNNNQGHGIFQIGSGSIVPTSSLASTATSPLLNNPGDTMDGTDLVFANLPGGNGSYNGYDVIYAVGGASGAQAISKYAFNNSNGLFNLVNAVTPAAFGSTTGVNNTLLGVTIAEDGSNNVSLYYTDLAGLFEMTDSSETAFGSLPGSASSTPLVPNGTNEAILGVAFAPTAVPEPTSLGLLAITGAGLLSRRRRPA